jgi:hypothetical protein
VAEHQQAAIREVLVAAQALFLLLRAQRGLQVRAITVGAAQTLLIAAETPLWLVAVAAARERWGVVVTLLAVPVMAEAERHGVTALLMLVAVAVAVTFIVEEDRVVPEAALLAADLIHLLQAVLQTLAAVVAASEMLTTRGRMLAS